jgi:type I restriction enzyme S subunit
VRSGDHLKIDFFGLALLNLQTHFEDLGQGATGQTELNRQSIANTHLVVPNLDTQEAFAEIVAPMRKEAILLGITNANLRRTRDLLLPKLISGEVDVSNSDISAEAWQGAFS